MVGIGFYTVPAGRGDVLPGLVGVILAAILVFLVITRFEQQTEARRRDRER